LAAPAAKQQVSLQQYAGKVTVVDFWATWCAPCHESFPVYQRISQKYGGQVAVVGISVDEDPAGIAKFVKETGAKFSIAWDEGQLTSKSYQPPTASCASCIPAFTRVKSRSSRRRSTRCSSEALLGAALTRFVSLTFRLAPAA
jgi:thiol-disulfide isomerase/thioredoxin